MKNTQFDCYADGVEWEIEAKEASDAAAKFAILLSPSIRNIQYGQWAINMTIKDKHVVRTFEVLVFYTGYHCSVQPRVLTEERIKQQKK